MSDTLNIKIPDDMVYGSIHDTNNYGTLRVLKYISAREVEVEFLKTGYVFTSNTASIRTGVVKDKLKPSVYGVGYVGVGSYEQTTNGRSNKIYACWSGMLGRCYGEHRLIKYPTYVGCYVIPSWHNFQNFAKWYYENYPQDGNKYQLDKDLLVPHNKVYSPDTCIFVPSWLNSLMTARNAARGIWPLGVSKDGGKFKAEGHDKEGGKVTLGRFHCPMEAHLKWKECKLSVALERKGEMDNIDTRIYPNIVHMVTNCEVWHGDQ